MSCEHWTELMQRSLDGDLSAQERERLMDHIEHCPDCCDMYERLSRLSSDLENLPKVVPPYSLVDAILPRLEQLELGVLSEAGNAEEPPVSASRSAGGTSGSELSELIAGSRRKRETRNGGWRKWTGGAAAAAAVAALFVAVYNAPDLNVGKLVQTAADTSAEKQEVTGSTKSTAVAPFVSAEPDTNAGKEKADAGVSAPAASADPQQYARSGNDDGSLPAESAVPKEPAHDSNGTNNSSGGQTEPEDAGSLETAMPPAQSDDAAAPPVGTGVAEAPLFGISSMGTGSDNPETETGDGGTEEQYYSLDQGQAGTTDDAGGNGQASGETVAPVIPGPIQAVSGDGQYSAVAVGYTIKIFDSNDELLFETERKNGRISELVWSSDSTELTYVVEAEEGAKEKYRIDIATWKDEKAEAE